MKRQSFTGYTARAISRCVLIALVSTFTVSGQTDAACRQRQFGKFSEWSAPVILDPVVNTNLTFWPSISPNGLSLYFGSNRPGGIPGADRQDIWVTRRASLDAPWEEPRNLGPNEQWNRRVGKWNDAGEYGPPEVVSDATGVYIAGGNNLYTSLPGYCRSGSAADSFVRKYSPDGAELWTRQFGTHDASLAHGVAVNDNGVFVAGQVGEGRWDLFRYPNPARAAYLARFEKAAAAIGGSRPRIFPDCVVNAASYVGGGVTPGEIVTVFGSTIEPAELAPPELDGDGRLATTLSDTSILFNGVAAPLVYVSGKQSSAIVPYTVSGRTSVDVQVEYAGVRSEAVTVPVLASRPGIFSRDGSGRGQGAILNEDGTFNSPSNPARRGSTITIVWNGRWRGRPGRSGRPDCRRRFFPDQLAGFSIV